MADDFSDWAVATCPNPAISRSGSTQRNLIEEKRFDMINQLLLLLFLC
jgi:hypothetical protein